MLADPSHHATQAFYLLPRVSGRWQTTTRSGRRKALRPILPPYFTIHVIRVDDGAIAELPLSLYYLLGGQWPTSSGYASLAQALANYPGPGGDEAPGGRCNPLTT